MPISLKVGRKLISRRAGRVVLDYMSSIQTNDCIKSQSGETVQMKKKSNAAKDVIKNLFSVKSTPSSTLNRFDVMSMMA